MTLRVASRRIVNYNGRAITDVTKWFRKSSHGQRSRERKLPCACVPVFTCVLHTFRNCGEGDYYENAKLLETGLSFHINFSTSCRNCLSIALVKQWKMWRVRGVVWAMDWSDTVMKVIVKLSVRRLFGFKQIYAITSTVSDTRMH